MPIRVVIVDDHGIVRKGLRLYLNSDPEIEVVGEARDGAEAISIVERLAPDVVLMDLIMPGMDGITATTAIRNTMPDTEVVALTSVIEQASVEDAVRAGAIGFLLKDVDADGLCRAIKAAAAGQVQLAPRVAERMLQKLITPEPSTPSLTEREIDVLQLLALGKSNKEIAQSLHIAEQTTKTHVSHILNKLNVPSRTQAALYAIQNGLVPSE